MARPIGLGIIAAVACGTASCGDQASDLPATETRPSAAAGHDAATSTASGPTADPASCVTYDGAYAAAPLMQVRGAARERVNLHTRAEACPAASACDWRQDAYVVGGDVVFASAPVNGFRCAYVGTVGDKLIAGFLPADRLEPVQDAQPLTPEFLSGTWVFEGDNGVAFSTSGGLTTVRGRAVYGEQGDQNFGEFDGAVTLSGSTAVYAKDGCEVIFERRGPYLVVRDNSGCGGANVSFSGIYVSAQAEGPPRSRP